MNYFDIIFILIIVWAAIRGFSTGFIVQLSSLVAIIIGAYVAYKMSYLLVDKISDVLTADPIIVNTIAFVITFGVVWALVVLLGKFLNLVVKTAMLGMLNRIVGLVFAVAKTVFVLSVVLMLIGNLNISLKFLSEEQTNSSLLYKPIEKFAPAVFPYLKNGFADAQQRWDEYQKKLEEQKNNDETK